VIEIVRLREVEALGVRAIAQRLALSRNTVRTYVREPTMITYGPRRPALGRRTSVPHPLHVATLLVPQRSSQPYAARVPPTMAP